VVALFGLLNSALPSSSLACARSLIVGISNAESTFAVLGGPLLPTSSPVQACRNLSKRMDFSTEQVIRRHCRNDRRMSLSDPAARVASFDAESRSSALASAGAVPSFPELYSRYFNFVWSCTRRMGVIESELDDVVQEIFIIVHRKLATLEQPDSLRSWIYGIIRRTASAHHRARRTNVASTAALNLESELQYPQQPSPLELAEQSDQVKLLWSLLEKLDPSRREVLVLAELDGLTAPEIANAIEIPMNTVYSRLRSARQELEAALARHHAQNGRGGRS